MLNYYKKGILKILIINSLFILKMNTAVLTCYKLFAYEPDGTACLGNIGGGGQDGICVRGNCYSECDSNNRCVGNRCYDVTKRNTDPNETDSQKKEDKHYHICATVLTGRLSDTKYEKYSYESLEGITCYGSLDGAGCRTNSIGTSLLA